LALTLFFIHYGKIKLAINCQIGNRWVMASHLNCLNNESSITSTKPMGNIFWIGLIAYPE